jgi:hypothetical protein
VWGVNWTWVWVGVSAVFALGLALFAVFEGLALRQGKVRRTYTYAIRRWLGIEPPRRRRRLAGAVFAAVLVLFPVWFVPHILWFPTATWWGL